MKKILFALLAVAFVSSLCFAQEPSATVDETKTFTGKIESIKRYIKSSPPKWEHAMLTVVADSGEKTIVYVIKATVVTNASGKDMSEGGKGFGVFSLKKGERIEVKYSTVKKDHNEAISIRCVPFDYVQQPTAPTTPAKAAPETTTQSDNALIGRITKITPPGGIIGNKRMPFWRIKFVPDNGEEYHILLITGKTVIIDVDGKPLTGIPASLKENKKAEVEYSEDKSIFADGKDADSIRYLSSDSAQQQIAPTTPIQVTPGTTTRPENIFTGRVEKVTPTIYRSPSQPYCKIMAVADSGEKSIFFVSKNTFVNDTAGKDMCEGGKKLGAFFIKKGGHIEVKYSIITNGSTITNGQNGAVSIRCLD